MTFKTLAFILGTLSVIVYSKEAFFRRDYTYIEEYNAFYKLHDADASSWKEAFITCNDEGAQLFYPQDLKEWHVATNLSESSTDLEEIFVGIWDEFYQGTFLTVDGYFVPDFFKKSIMNQRPTETKCVVMSTLTGVNSIGSCEIAFVCKKFNNEQCPTVDPGSGLYISSKTEHNCSAVSVSKNDDESFYMNTNSVDCDIPSPFICEMNVIL